MKKMLYFGLGALSITREKAEKLYNELEERGEVSKEDAKRFVEEAIKRGEEDQAAVKEMIQKEWQSIKDDLPLVSRSEFDALQDRIKELEAKLNGVSNSDNSSDR